MKNDSSLPTSQEPSPEATFTAGPYTLTETALRFRAKPDDSGDRGRWVSDGFELHAQVYVEWSPPFIDKSGWAVLIEFAQPDGQRQRRLVFYGDLHTQGDQVIAGLSRAGMRIDVERKGRALVLNYLMRIRPPVLLRLGGIKVGETDGVLCLRAFDLAPEGGAYELRSYELCDLHDGGRKLPPVVRALDDGDVI
jgi:hypothetical protein